MAARSHWTRKPAATSLPQIKSNCLTPLRNNRLPTLKHAKSSVGSSIARASSCPIHFDVKVVGENSALNALIEQILQESFEGECTTFDFSSIGFSTLPSALFQLKYYTPFSQKGGFCDISVYLNSNQLCSLSEEIFSIAKTSVLSLRSNALKCISPSVFRLTHLTELSIGSNQISFLPAELLSLPNLKVASLFPNPFWDAEKVEVYNRTHASTNEPSLQEMALRSLFRDALPDNSAKFLPIKQKISPSLRNDILNKAYRCTRCHCVIFDEYSSFIRFGSLCGSADVPFLYKSCSITCQMALNK